MVPNVVALQDLFCCMTWWGRKYIPRPSIYSNSFFLGFAIVSLRICQLATKQKTLRSFSRTSPRASWEVSTWIGAPHNFAPYLVIDFIDCWPRCRCEIIELKLPDRYPKILIGFWKEKPIGQTEGYSSHRSLLKNCLQLSIHGDILVLVFEKKHQLHVCLCSTCLQLL